MLLPQDELFFQRVNNALFITDQPFKGLQWVVVSHLVKDVEIFIDTLQALAPVRAVISKQRTIDEDTKKQLVETGYKIYPADRTDLRQPECLAELFSPNSRYLIIDVGGYFAHALPPGIQDRVAGIIECTENGHQRYLRLLQATELPYPIYSVARSPLKENEDDLVGHSVGFYTEVALRRRYIAPRHLTKAIIGYGKVGRGIAAYHLQQHSPPLVYDSDPIAQLRALKDGCIPVERDELLCRADVIFCATGSKSLAMSDVPKLKDDCFIASATSADDEFGFFIEDLSSAGYTVLPSRHNTQEVRKNQKRFFMINQGNAVNFVMPGDRVGSFIRPVQAEALAAAMSVLSAKPLTSEIMEVERTTRQKLAKILLETYFLS